MLVIHCIDFANAQNAKQFLHFPLGRLLAAREGRHKIIWASRFILYPTPLLLRDDKSHCGCCSLLSEKKNELSF